MVRQQGGLRPIDATASIDLLLAGAFPDVAFTIRQLQQVASPSLAKDDVMRLADEIRSLLSSEICSVVVVQGTDTIEETSFYLDLVVDSPKPVVVTGAMRGADAPSADGPANLIAAVSVAIDVRSEGQGCLVVMNDEIHGAADVRKRHTSALGAFVSPNFGSLGNLVEGKVRYFSRMRETSRILLRPTRIADVAMHSVAIWDDGRSLRGLKDLGYDGLVLQAMGAGHVPQIMLPELAPLANVMPIVLCSRTAEGMVHTETYAYPGSEKDLLAIGVIPAGFLHASKARVLLATLLGSGVSAAEIPRSFRRFTGSTP
jgi:L-asparaginase